MSVETVQRVFKTFTDPSRIRILALLEREELAVQDLVQILGLAQSSVSRHLGILRDAHLLRDRKQGTYAYYRFVSPTGREWRAAWELAKGALRDDPIARRDEEALESLLRERTVASRRWFDRVGADWDRLRQVFHDDVQRARAIVKLIPADLRVADIGTGTGILAMELARSGARVIAIDHSRRMLAAAEGKLAEAHVHNVELRHGDAADLPLADAEVDAALAHMVLHYVASPGEAVREMARVVRPRGRVVVVDFVANDREWLQSELGVLWRGFDEATLGQWFAAAGLVGFAFETFAPHAKSTDLPATFIASAYRPDPAS